MNRLLRFLSSYPNAFFFFSIKTLLLSAPEPTVQFHCFCRPLSWSRPSRHLPRVFPFLHLHAAQERFEHLFSTHYTLPSVFLGMNLKREFHVHLPPLLDFLYVNPLQTFEVPSFPVLPESLLLRTLRLCPQGPKAHVLSCLLPIWMP